MATYGPGQIFETAQTFGPGDVFLDGCVFAPGTVFLNPCTVGEGCTGGPVNFALYDDDLPAHETGNGCIWACGSSFQWINIGTANVACDPAVWEPFSVGADTIVGQGNNRAIGEGTHSEDCQGHEVIDNAGVNQPYDYCSKRCGTGIVTGNAEVTDPSRCLP